MYIPAQNWTHLPLSLAELSALAKSPHGSSGLVVNAPACWLIFGAESPENMLMLFTIKSQNILTNTQNGTLYQETLKYPANTKRRVSTTLNSVKGKSLEVNNKLPLVSWNTDYQQIYLPIEKSENPPSRSTLDEEGVVGLEGGAAGIRGGTELPLPSLVVVGGGRIRFEEEGGGGSREPPGSADLNYAQS